jgi:hypothetical protein
MERNGNNYLQMFSPDVDESGIVFGKPSLNIRAAVIGDPTDGLQFRTGGNTTRMTIDAGGDVGIGTTAPVDRLQVFGNVRVGTSGTNGCLKRFDGTALAGTCSSDAGFKTRISPFPSTLSRLAQLRPVHYYWRASEFPERAFGDTQSYGLVAQEVERVLPELVSKDDKGYKMVDYSKLPLLTIQAVKELKQETDRLKAHIEAQKKEIEMLKVRAAEVDAIKDLLCAQNTDASICKPKLQR